MPGYSNTAPEIATLVREASDRPTRQFVATQHFGRFRSEADIHLAALTESGFTSSEAPQRRKLGFDPRFAGLEEILCAPDCVFPK